MGSQVRLKSHRAGRRSGDQFCVYVGDWLVFPNLTSSEIEAIATRAVSFDHLIRDFIQSRLGFRFVETQSGTAALELERLGRAGSLGQLPLLNPTCLDLRSNENARARCHTTTPTGRHWEVITAFDLVCFGL